MTLTPSVRLHLSLLLLVLIGSPALAKHGAPPSLESVVYEGVRYVLPNYNGLRAYVEAWDVQSGRRLWTRTIFRRWYVPLPFVGTECMHYEYVTSMELRTNQIVFRSERGKDYVLDPRKRT